MEQGTGVRPLSVWGDRCERYPPKPSCSGSAVSKG